MGDQQMPADLRAALNRGIYEHGGNDNGKAGVY